jgi:hypothetical protein
MPDCRVATYGFCRGCCDSCNPYEVAETIALVATDQPKIAQVCLEDLGFGKLLASIPTKPSKAEPFRCAVLDTVVVIPCNLHGCPYWVDRPAASNCLLCYFRHREGTEELQVRDIADVLDLTISETNTQLEEGLTRLRHMAIGMPVGRQDLQATFEFIPTGEVCCVCERLVPQDQKDILRIPGLGLAYCSLSCRIRKSPRVIGLEHRFHVDIAEILEWALTNFTDEAAMEQALGMDSYALQQLIAQFLGPDALEDFPGEVIPEASQPSETLFALNTLEV